MKVEQQQSKLKTMANVVGYNQLVTCPMKIIFVVVCMVRSIPNDTDKCLACWTLHTLSQLDLRQVRK